MMETCAWALLLRDGSELSAMSFWLEDNDSYHVQAVRLADGRVLSFGGVNPENAAPLASCEAYSILTNSWTTCPSLLTPRGSFQVCAQRPLLSHEFSELPLS